MDVEAVVARHLAKELDIQAVLEVPVDRPDTFLCVEQTGGGGRFIQQISIDVDCWAQTRKEAQELAIRVQDAIPTLSTIENLFAPTSENIYRNPDPDTYTPRYTVQLVVSVCE